MKTHTIPSSSTLIESRESRKAEKTSRASLLGWEPVEKSPCSACIVANSLCLSDLYNSGDDSVCQLADVFFMCLHVKVGSSLFISLCVRI